MIRIKRDLLNSPEESEEYTESPTTISPETIEKIRSWYTVNPEGNTDQCRKAIKKSWSTVREGERILTGRGEFRRV